MLRLRLHECCSLEKWWKHHTYTITDVPCFDYPRWKAKNHWCSVDTHFHDWAGSVSLSLFSIEVANTLITYGNDQIAFQLPDLRVVLATVPDRHFWSGSRLIQTVAKLAVQVVNKAKLPTQVRFHGKLPPRLNWEGCKQVAQRVHL